MTEIIFRHNGTIDKYVGDMIMAFWGAPLKDASHAQHAMAAALEMQKAVAVLRDEFRARNWPEINIGIGLNTGLMSVGDMGSKFRRNYTVLGDSVNLGSRVEGLTKYYGAGIIVTENTMTAHTDIVFRKLDRVRVKGKNNTIELYEPICQASELTMAMKQELDQYHVALSAWFAREWQKAHDIFATLCKLHPEHRLYALYLKRVKEFINSPPSSEWDGVFVHTEK